MLSARRRRFWRRFRKGTVVSSSQVRDEVVSSLVLHRGVGENRRGWESTKKSGEVVTQVIESS